MCVFATKLLHLLAVYAHLPSDFYVAHIQWCSSSICVEKQVSKTLRRKEGVWKALVCHVCRVEKGSFCTCCTVVNCLGFLYD